MTVHEITTPDRTDVVKALRNIADSIENDEYGDVQEAVVITLGSQLEILGLGRADTATSYYLLGLGQRKLEGLGGIYELP